MSGASDDINPELVAAEHKCNDTSVQMYSCVLHARVQLLCASDPSVPSCSL
mgnify:CR=1 FL=1